MYQNIVWDYGNVLVQYRELDIARAFVSEKDAPLFASVVFDRLYFDRMDAGKLEEREFVEAAKRRLPLSLHPHIHEAFNLWFFHLPPTDGMPELTEELYRAGRKQYLISNASKELAVTAPHLPTFRRFSGMVFSATAGMLKPHEDIFRHFLKLYGLQAEDCLFIDDRAENVAGAEAVGMGGYRFDGNTAALRAFLSEQGILPPNV